MSTTTELVLCYLPLPPAGKIKAVFASLGLRVKSITPDQCGQTVGFLAGLKGFPPLDAPAVPAIPVPLLVFCGLSSPRLDAVLKALRAAGAPPVPHKAVLTTSNAPWTLSALYRELDGERRAIAEAQGQSSPK